MTPEQLRDALLEQGGWTTYPSSRANTISMDGPRLSGPKCEANDRPPPFLIDIFEGQPPGGGHPGSPPSATVWTFGERDDEVLRCQIYSVPLARVLSKTDGYRLTLEASWAQFCTYQLLGKEEPGEET
jgi:hypothetical protein